MLRHLAGAVVAIGVLATPLSAQHALVLNMNGGGYEHLMNLNQYGNPIADFKPGYNLGFSVGYEVTRWVSIHADFTFADAQARGASSFSGDDVERVFYGAHVEMRYPQRSGWTPFAFVGGGAVTVSQETGTGLPTFTRPAGSFGLGIGYDMPRAPFEVFVETKGLVYKWDIVGFDRLQTDVTYSLGFSYRVRW